MYHKFNKHNYSMKKYGNKYLILGINLGDFGSTGNIMINSLEYAYKNGPFDVMACVPHITNNNSPVSLFSFDAKIPMFMQRFYNILRRFERPIINDGNYYRQTTKKLIRYIAKTSKTYKKTIIHLHNIHMCNIDINIFYKFLAKKNYIVLYTLHDCWAFTGGCYYYDYINCNNWQTKCKNCPQRIKYSNKQLMKRTMLLKKIKNLTLIPCSKWLDDEIKKSRLKNIPTIVNNGETSIEPYVGHSQLKQLYNIENKKILISVSAYWVEWKGIKYLYQLADKLPSDYVLLLVGGNIENGHNNIIHVPSISDSNLLAEYYSISDVFVSATQSDNLPLVLMEAQICGVPIVGFGHGGTPEEITEKSGIMVGTDNDVDKLLEAIKYVVEKKPFKKEDIIASGNRFKKYESAKRQLKIYNDIIRDI